MIDLYSIEAYVRHSSFTRKVRILKIVWRLTVEHFWSLFRMRYGPKTKVPSDVIEALVKGEVIKEPLSQYDAPECCIGCWKLRHEKQGYFCAREDEKPCSKYEEFVK